MLLGSIEAGGTKFVCAIGEHDSCQPIKKITIPTREPKETMADVFKFFDEYDCAAIGIGSFGPIDIDKNSKTYGYITNTPKLLWQNFNFLGEMQTRYPSTKFGFTTDVSAAALGEYKQGAGLTITGKTLLYMTVGTGIGAGLVKDSQIITGYSALEMGHVLVNRIEEDDFKGCCPYHEYCLEGMAAGPSFEARLGIKGKDVPLNHEVWDYIAYYIAQGVYQYTLTNSPDVIVIGGGVMSREEILERVKYYFSKLNNGYAKVPPIDDYIVLPKLASQAGIIGGLELAKLAMMTEC